MDITSLLLLGLAALGVVSSNSPITIAMVVLLLIRVLGLQQAFPWLEKYGLTVGIIILTIGVMTPLASGKISSRPSASRSCTGNPWPPSESASWSLTWADAEPCSWAASRPSSPGFSSEPSLAWLCSKAYRWAR